jgi:4-carboxymuconolactone decarboxylase
MPPSPPDYRHPTADLDSGLAGIDRTGADAPERVRLVLAAAATALGRADVCRAALRIALRDGVAPERLREAVLQTYLFAGYPRAINALGELSALSPVPGPGVDPGADAGQMPQWRERGEDLCRRVYGEERYPRLLELMGRISPELGRWMVVEGYGKVLSRPGLDAVTRELVAVGALLVLHVPAQLAAHLRGALLVGARPDEVTAAVRTGALLAPERLVEAGELLDRARREAGAG